jgi:DNA-binding response OmpR family regulator
MLTAKREQEDRVVALRAGVDVFLTKPLNKDELIARLQIAERILSIESEGEKRAAAA